MKRSLTLLWSCLVFCGVQIGHAQTIREQIDAILTRPAVAANSWTILVQNDAGTVTYYDRNPTMGQIPASNAKLFTLATAFALLGTNHTFESRIYCNGVLTNGTLFGDLNLVSEHDMTWNEHTFGTGNARMGLDYIAAKLKSQGLTNIVGNVQCYGVCYYKRLSSDTTHNSQSQDVYNAETAVAFVAALQAQGIGVSGSATGQIGFKPPGFLFYTHQSSNLNYLGQPLTLDVACIPLAKVSHNVMADELLRHIGYKLSGVDSFPAGSALVLNWLQNNVGIPTNGIVLNDGSGLSHGDTASALQITRLFRYMLGNFSSWSVIFPIGCVYDSPEGSTLSSRFCNTDGAGQVHAKTGSLTPAIALSGYIDNKYTGRRFLFSFLSNNSSGIDQDATRNAIDDCVNLFGAPTMNCIDPANLGKGDWIWRVPNSITAVGASDVQGLVNFEKAKGMQWITVKCGDGNTIWSQFDSNLVAQCHAAGLKVFAWAYAYGGGYTTNNPTDVPGEINVASNALSMGADGFIIDAEDEYERLGVTNAALNAQQYCEGIRAIFPHTFLAYAPYVVFNSVRTNLYRTFGKYCDAVMPQAYYSSGDVSVSNKVHQLDSEWTAAQNLWISTGYYDSVKPIVPIGWGASPATGSDITNFVDLLKTDPMPATAGGYNGVSFWVCQSHTPDIWNAIASIIIGPNPPLPSPHPAPILLPIADKTIGVTQTLTFTNTATLVETEVTNNFADFENASGAQVMFQAPNYSGTTVAYIDTTAAFSSGVVTNFPAPHLGNKVVKTSWSFATGKTGSWLRLTTSAANGYPNPTVSFTNALQFDIFTDKAVQLGLGLRESSSTAAIGANAGSSSATIEFVGVSSKTGGGTPNPTRTINAGSWTTVRFNIPQEPVTTLNGNGILESTTGKGTLEHLAIVPAGGLGAYNVYFDNFQDVTPNKLTFSLDSGAPTNATINPVTGVFSWTPMVFQGPAVYPITVRVSDNNVPPASASRTIFVTVTRTLYAPVTASMTNQQLHLQFPADPGVTYAIQMATNLTSPMNWQTIGVTNASDTSIDFAAGVTNDTQRFFRILSQ